MELTKIETTKLAQCERTIREGMRTFYDVGAALRTIRDEKLYRAEHETFEDYCEVVHGWTRQRGYQLIEAADATDIIQKCQPLVDTARLSERAVRPVASLPEGQQAQAIRKAVELAEEDNDEHPVVTAKHLKKAAEMVGGAKPHKRTKADESGPKPTPEKPLRCQLDKPVDPKSKLAAAMRVEPEIAEAMADIQRLRKKIEGMADGPAGVFMHQQEMDLDLKNVWSALKFARPYTLCPTCGGDGCKVCHKSGWVNEQTFKTCDKAAQEMARTRK